MLFPWLLVIKMCAAYVSRIRYLKMMFILSALVLIMCFFPSNTACGLSVVNFPLSAIVSSINQSHFHMWIIINFIDVWVWKIFSTGTRIHPHELTLAKLISGATQHCRTSPASRRVDAFTPTSSHLGDVCLLAWHSSNLLPPGTFPFSPENPTLPHTWPCLFHLPMHERGSAVPQAYNMLASEGLACSAGTELKK